MTAISSRVTSVASMLERRTRKSPGAGRCARRDLPGEPIHALVGPAVPLDAIVAEVNAGENHFAVAGCDESLDFVQDMLNWPAAEMGAHLGNDAEGAVQQAAILDFDVGALAIGVGADAVRDVDNAEAAEEIGEFAFVGDDFGDAGEGSNFVRRASGVTAHHDDARARIAGGQLADGLAAFGVALMRDRASVDDAKIGTLAFGSILIADAIECLADKFCFVLIDFAAERYGAKQWTARYRFFLRGREHGSDHRTKGETRCASRYSTGSMVADIEPLQPAIRSSLPKA